MTRGIMANLVDEFCTPMNFIALYSYNGEDNGEKFELQCEREFIYLATKEWLDLMLDLIISPPPERTAWPKSDEFEETWDNQIEQLTAYAITKLGPRVLTHVQILLTDNQYRVMGIDILGMCMLPEALEMLHPFVDHFPQLTFDEFCALVSAVTGIGGQQGHAMLKRMRDIAPEEWLQHEQPWLNDAGTMQQCIDTYLEAPDKWRDDGYLLEWFRSRYFGPGFPMS